MVDVKCKDCYWRAYTVGSKTWRTRGTVTRYPDLYCDSCCEGSHSGWSWSGNVVKMECKGCSNVVVPITWSDWNNKRTQYQGRCSSCRDKERERVLYPYKVYSDISGNLLYKGASYSQKQYYEGVAKKERLDRAKTKAHYCPENYSVTIPSWADVQHSIDSYNFYWTKFTMYCKASARHCLYYKPSISDDAAAQKYHGEIAAKLSLSECPQCKSVKDEQIRMEKAGKDATAKLDALSANVANIKNLLDGINISNESKSDDAKSDGNGDNNDTSAAKAKLLDIQNKEKEVMDMIHEFKSAKDDILLARTKNKDIITNISANSTYPTEEKLQAATNELDNLLTQCTKEKASLNKQIEAANKREMELLKNDEQHNKDSKEALENEAKLTDLNTQIDEAKAKLATFTGAELKAKGDSIKEFSQVFDDLVENMKLKCQENDKRKNELKQCQERMKKIKAKLKREKSDCKYLIQLINKECEMIRTATDEAMDKFEERATYFLSVTVGLKQDSVEKLIDWDLDDILELTEDEMVEEGIKGGEKKKLVRHIKEWKAKMAK